MKEEEPEKDNESQDRPEKHKKDQGVTNKK